MDPALRGVQYPNGADMVARFMQHKAPEYHPAWQNSIAKANLAPPAPITRRNFSQTAAQLTERFKAKIEGLSQRSSNKQVKKVLEKHSIYGKTTWQDVQKEAEEALNAYRFRGERNLFVKAGRSTGKKAPALQSWLELLPSDQYCSIARGALALFFGAATAIAKTFKQVQETIETLTDTVDNVAQCLRLYNDDDLSRKAEELYIAVLEGTEEMLSWLDSNGFKEAVKATFQQNCYNSRVEEKISAIQARAEDFAHKLTVLLHERIARIEMQQCESWQSVRALESLLRAKLQTASYFNATSVVNVTQYIEAPPMIQQSQTISGDEVLDLFGVDLATTPQDLAWAANSGYEPAVGDQHRAMHLLQHPRFEHWLVSEDSDLLVVDDMERERTRNPDRPSPVTYLAAKLVRTVASLGLGLPLVFFCGLHSTEGDPLEGGAGMMKNINSQFLEQFRGYDASFVEPELLEQIHESSPQVQWKLFQTLMENIRPLVVFCVIDSLSEFDNGRHGADIPGLMGAFQDMVESLNGAGPGGRSGRPILKVLVTMPEMSASSAMWFADEPLSVPESTPDMIEGIGDDYLTGSVQDIYGEHGADRYGGWLNGVQGAGGR
ncbi:uncharacterized protein BKCO1_4500070 [Diplodia corticola]|uniref:DUF7708 domain-containing protein n=1 Tax=Diplodia corticola TaxID=236234 RepID=A0A1J9QUV5_9PEZI|nr:uncharacterized protein BKCO1_4500070 [Diplodia corticola]OJD31754.1 hypothetical protein BKCO1_4500070 [Diplodia corticola]